MSPKIMTTIRMEPEVLDLMHDVKAKEGTPIAAQVDLAMRAWLKEKGFAIETERKRPDRQKRRKK
jgi:hypothetical protein